MRRALSSLWLLLGLAPGLVGFGPPALVESHAARAPVTEATLRAIPLSAPPAVRPRAGILVDAATGSVLWERDADARLPMASTTKVMTALVALERARLETPIQVRVGAGELPGSSVAGLKAGEQLSLRDMTYALMLPSGNDAALAIAGTLAPSIDLFVQLMNRRALELGLRNTRFANPHGLDAPNQHSSARDLAALARAALAVPFLAEVAATREHATPAGGPSYRWTNTNRLLALRPDVTGLKTGTETLAGAVLVATARQGDRATYAVVLGSPDRWGETAALFDYFFKGHAAVQPTLPPSPFYRGLTARPQPNVVVPTWQAGLLAAELRIADDDNGVGLVEYWLAGRALGQIALARP